MGTCSTGRSQFAFVQCIWMKIQYSLFCDKKEMFMTKRMSRVRAGLASRWQSATLANIITEYWVVVQSLMPVGVPCHVHAQHRFWKQLHQISVPLCYLSNGLKDHKSKIQKSSNTVPLVQQNCLNDCSAPRDPQLMAWSKDSRSQIFNIQSIIFESCAIPSSITLEMFTYRKENTLEWNTWG